MAIVWSRWRWRTWAGLPAGVLLVGLLMTGAVGFNAWMEQSRTAQALFERHVDQLSEDILRRFERSLEVLHGLAGVFATNPGVSRAQFRQAVEIHDLAAELPGVRGFGYVERVAPARLAGFLTEQRTELPEFALRQIDQIDRGAHFIVKYTEPMQANRSALGLDVGSEPVRRAAIDKAVDSGQPSLTAGLALAQDVRQGAGLLLYVPVYAGQSQPQTASARREQLVGLLSTQIVLGELLASIEALRMGTVKLELVDSSDPAQQGPVLYRSAAQLDSPQGAGGALARVVSLPGRAVVLRATPTARFHDGRNGAEFWILVVTGTLISVLMSALAWQLVNGQRSAEELARRLSAQARTLQVVARDTVNAVLTLGIDRRITWANASFERLTGFSAQDAIGIRPIDLGLTARLDSATNARITDALDQGQPIRIDLPILTRAGGERWLELQFQPLHGDSGTLEGFMLIALDVTERRQMVAQLEDALREHDALLLTMNLRFLVSVTDRMGRITMVNDAFSTLSGYRAEELVGQNHRIVNSGVHGPEFWASVWQTISAGQVWQGEVCNRAKNGSLYWVGTVIAPFKDAQGKIEKYVSIRHDVTQRHAAEQVAQRNLTLLRGAIEAIDEAFVLFDPQDRIVFCNEKYRQLHGPVAHLVVPGISFEELLRKGIEFGLPVLAADQVESWVAEQVALHQSGHTTLNKAWGDGGALRIVERKMPDGHIVGFRIDITELVRARAAAEEALLVKGNFLANMSHEIRTPMHAILGMTALLRQTELSAQQADYANKTERAAQSMLGLLNDILDFSKFEAGKLALDPQPFRMDQLLRDLSVIFSASVSKEGVDVLFDLDPALPRTLVGDALRLRQVLINLGGNAIKFTQQGEVVLCVQVLQARPGEVDLRFGVRDTGIGIAPENLSRIFDAFTQAEASTTRRFGGTGLGMAISKNLVELMGGELRGESQVDVGSHFHFDITLPAVPDDLAEVFLDAASARAWRTLVVDDNPLARELLERMGLSLGWDVESCASGEEALHRVQSGASMGKPYQVVLVDWQMPGLDGWQTSQAIRALNLGVPAPLVVMVSAHGREMLSQRSAAEQAMVDGYLIKPITASMLFDAVVDAQAGHDRPHPSRIRSARQGERLLGMRLLVVEDNVINQQVARELLQNEGALVQLASDGQQGVDAVASASIPFDVVLMDLQMPVMDGFDATRHIRNELGLKDLPIVAMTANAMASDRAECLACGMNEHVAKPFDIHHVVGLLRHQARWPELASASLQANSGPPDSQIRQVARLAGMELEAALDRLGGRLDIYARMLKTFHAELSALPDQLHAAVTQGRVPDAKHQMHTLKGLAATLGIPQLAAEAAQAERQLAAAETASEASAVVRQVCGALRAAAPGLVSLLQLIAAPQQASQAVASASEHGGFEADLVEALEVLAIQLRQGDMAATTGIQELVRQFAPAHPALLSPLEEAVSALDFGRAIELCEALIDECRSADPSAPAAA